MICSDAKVNKCGYLILLVLMILIVTTSGVSIANGYDISDNTSQDELLYWPPPELTDPITIQLSNEARRVIRMESDQDYIIEFPDEPLRGNLILSGGRNVVVIGGEIAIPWQGDDPLIRHRTGVTIYNPEGVLHIEGLLIRGEDLSEGFQITAPDAIVQLQNIAVVDIHARDQINFSDNHPDLIQTLGNVGELRVDRFTGSTDYQGFFFKSDMGGPHNSVHLRHVNIIGLPTARYLFWIHNIQWRSGQILPVEWAGEVTLDDVWLQIPEERKDGLGDSVWPPAHIAYPNQAQLFTDDNGNLCIRWPEEMKPAVTGYICEGLPEGGNFVSVEDVGIGYESPGYRNTTGESTN